MSERSKATRGEGGPGFEMLEAAFLLVLLTAAIALGIHWFSSRSASAPIDAPSADLLSHPSVQREVQKKERLRAAAALRSHAAKPEDGRRLPEGQTAAKKWIVLDLGLRPSPGAYSLEPSEWKLTICTPSGNLAVLSMDDILALGVRQYAEQTWHCVTGWSALALTFEGVPLASVLAHPKVLASAGGVEPQWTWLFQRAADGYTVPVLREDALGAEAGADAFLALTHAGEPLPLEHGGPRLVFPALFGWKSAKWLTRIELAPSYSPGFWEKCGCHARGRVARNERFREGWSAAIWYWLAAAPGVYRRFGGYEVWIFVIQSGGRVLGTIVDRFTSLHAVPARDARRGDAPR